ncbi:hypothetical protein AB0H76_37905 [Nocardia sp. NPDC050712]|uniref:DUF402 domain-containing protein n=1 Tax=Nocardia sp. NPDC050712 TaxID=3155518 RepID=UPI0033F15411
MSALLPLLVAMPTVTGVAGYVARGMRVPAIAGIPHTAPPGTLPARRPGVEYFDLSELITIDTRGFARQVENFRIESWGLYMGRVVAGKDFLQSWLLPELSVRVNLIHPAHLGHHHSLDYHLDIGEYGPTGPRRWKAVDHYLDIVVRHGHSSELRGIGNLLAAHAAGAVTTEQAHHALDRAAAALDGLAAYDHKVDRWLAAHGVTLTWL